MIFVFFLADLFWKLKYKIKVIFQTRFLTIAYNSQINVSSLEPSPNLPAYTPSCPVDIST